MFGTGNKKENPAQLAYVKKPVQLKFKFEIFLGF